MKFSHKKSGEEWANGNPRLQEVIHKKPPWSKLRYFTSDNVLLNLYYSFVQSHINYNLLNWSCANTTALNPLRNSVKKVVRIIPFKNKYEHTLPLFKSLKILPLDAQIKHKQGIFMWKLSKNLIPPPASFLFNRIDKNQYGKYTLPNPRSELGKRMIRYSCVKVWNTEVPLHLKSLTSLKIFNQKYKEYLLNLLNWKHQTKHEKQHKQYNKTTDDIKPMGYHLTANSLPLANM